MAITHRASTVSAATASATAPVITVPAGLTATDISLMFVEAKRTTSGTTTTSTTPSGWALLATATLGATGVANAADVGNVDLYVYYRTGTYTAPTLAIGAANSVGVSITAYTTSLGAWAPFTSTSGVDATSGANGSITAGAGLSVTSGDWVVAGVGHPGDLGTMSAQTVAGMSGATLGTNTVRQNGAVTTGNDSRIQVVDRPISSGSSTSAPTFAWTNASNMTGVALFVRLREQSAPGLPITDAFGRTSTADPGFADSGHLWRPEIGVWRTDGAALTNSSGLDGDQITVEAGATDQHITATITARPGGAWCLTGRWLNTGEFYIVECDPARVALKRVMSGGYTELAADPTVASVGDIIELIIVEEGGSGTRVRVERNGSEVINFLDTVGSRPLTGTRAGIRHGVSNASGIKWDDYSVTAPTTVPSGSGSGSWSFAGTGFGVRQPKGSGSGTLAYVGTGSGTTVRSGSGTGLLAWTGTGTGSAPRGGSGTGTWAYVGTGTGTRSPAGSGAGSWSFTGTGSGSTARSGTGSGLLTWVGSGTGTAPDVDDASGSGTGAWGFTGTGTGTRVSSGSGTGLVEWVGTGSGFAPAVGGASGSGSGTWGFTGDGTGSTTYSGSGAGAWGWAGTGTGTAPGAPRNITITVGPGRSRTLTATGRARSLTAVGRSRELAAAGASRTLTAAGRSRTLTAEPRE